QRLKARRVAKHAAELDVLAGRERGEHAPLLEQLALDLLDAGEALLARAEVVVCEVREHRVELVDDQPHPQLRRLVLDDEQQLVVVLGIRQRMLGGEQLVELEVGGVREAAAQVARDAVLDRAAVLTHAAAAQAASEARMTRSISSGVSSGGSAARA